jgi:hypothetical protein
LRHWIQQGDGTGPAGIRRAKKCNEENGLDGMANSHGSASLTTRKEARGAPKKPLFVEATTIIGQVNQLLGQLACPCVAEHELLTAPHRRFVPWPIYLHW